MTEVSHSFTDCRLEPRTLSRWFVTMMAANLLLLPLLLHGQTTTPPAPTAKPPAKTAQRSAAAPASYRLDTLPRRAREYYSIAWGVDSLGVRQVESGELIRFSWRIVDPERAKLLNDKKIEPELIDMQAGVKLVVPQVEFVGPLRQINTPEAGRTSWIAFSNIGRRVKPGDRVTIVIGPFHADGLLVQ